MIRNLDRALYFAIALLVLCTIAAGAMVRTARDIRSDLTASRAERVELAPCMAEIADVRVTLDVMEARYREAMKERPGRLDTVTRGVEPTRERY